tara:strand:+ start:226 stop:474 length:249 start_codon:yes stop_codon:yes gene_type:complete
MSPIRGQKMSVKRLTAKKITSSQMKTDSEVSENNSVRIQRMQNNPDYPIMVNSDTENVDNMMNIANFEGKNNVDFTGLNSKS